MTILTNALSGSLAAQAALDTTSHNIANLQTKGYTRQGVLLTTLALGGGGFAQQRLEPAGGVDFGGQDRGVVVAQS